MSKKLSKEEVKAVITKSLDLNHDGFLDVKDLEVAIAKVASDGKVTTSDFISLFIEIVGNSIR